jgi:hypothetical protein
VLFGLYEWRGANVAGSRRIVVGRGELQSLSASFERTWMRPPTGEELQGLVDDWVREEVAAREGIAQGHDQGDVIIRRRLRQKLEFLAAETVASAPPTAAQLQAWLEAHPDAFRRDPQLAFRQVYVSAARRGDGASAYARALVPRLAAAGPAANLDGLGDPLMLPNEVERTPRWSVASQFGEEFATALDSVPTGEWIGPIRSGFGLHVVLLRERVAGRQASLAEVRPDVEREVSAERNRAALDGLYRELREQYTVVMDTAGPSR